MGTPILFVEIFTLYTLFLSIHIWISDMVMTFFKTLTTLYPFLFVAVLLFINSETLLFIAYLWVMFSYLWICNINSILLPDPVELTFSNTLLLSIAATCLCVYSLTTSIFMLNIYLYYYFFLCKFVSINYYVFIFQILFLQVHFIL